MSGIRIQCQFNFRYETYIDDSPKNIKLGKVCLVNRMIYLASLILNWEKTSLANGTESVILPYNGHIITPKFCTHGRKTLENG